NDVCSEFDKAIEAFHLVVVVSSNRRSCHGSVVARSVHMLTVLLRSPHQKEHIPRLHMSPELPGILQMMERTRKPSTKVGGNGDSGSGRRTPGGSDIKRQLR